MCATFDLESPEESDARLRRVMADEHKKSQEYLKIFFDVEKRITKSVIVHGLAQPGDQAQINLPQVPFNR